MILLLPQILWLYILDIFNYTYNTRKDNNAKDNS